MCRKILTIQNLIINLAIKFCHTYIRWKTVHNNFLEKIPGQPLINKLRVIHIYEADWNYILKYFTANQLLRTATKEKATMKEQAGGRPGNNSITMAVQTTIVFEICRMQKLIIAKMFLDAKACYDRIITSLANIVCRSHGLSKELTKLYAQTLDLMEYHPKHQLGISLKPNGNNKPDPFHGAGQGSGDGGTRWGLITDSMIRIYNNTCHLTSITSPISHKTISEGVRIFVDDASLLTQAETEHQLTKKLETNTNKWESLLFATGGKLEIPKCNFSVMSWKENSAGIPQLHQNPEPTNIKVHNSITNQSETVPSIPPNQAYKLLGTHIALDGNMNKEYNHLLNKSIKHAAMFAQCHFNQEDITTGYNQVYMRTH